MKMNQKQFERFCFITDSLAIFANKKLKISDKLYNEKTKFVDAQERHKVFDALFEDHREIIDEFIEKNEYDLLDSQLEEIKSWKNAISGFFVYCGYKNEECIFSFNNKNAFAVTGTDNEIKNMIPDCPCVIETKLLPFEGLITYSRSIVRSCINFGPNIAKQIKEEQQKALKGNIINNAQDFREISGEINAEEAKNKASIKKEIDKIDKANEHRPIIPPSKGKHKGKLAGLNFKERNKKIEENKKLSIENYVKEYKEHPFSGMVAANNICEKPILNANEYFEKYPSPYLELIKKDTQAATFNCLKTIQDYPFKITKQAVNNNFKLTIHKKDYFEFLQYGPLSFFPYGSAFYHDNKLEVIIFKDYHSFFKNLDWNVIEKERKMTQAVINTCTKTSQLMGIVDGNDAYKQFCNWYPEYKYLYSEKSFFDTAAYPHAIPNCPKFYAEFGNKEEGNIRIINSRILENAGYADDENENINNEENEKYLSYIIAHLEERQKQLGFKPFPKKFRDEDVDIVCAQLPALFNLTQFLDERIPDEEIEFADIETEEYQFADRIIYDLIDSCLTNVNSFVKPNEFIEDWNLDFNDEELAEFFRLFSDSSNSLPHWDNVGRSPYEVMREQGGPKIFRNESGGIKKVGRNDPCPCGSGKKYKKCCGSVAKNN